MKTENQLVQFQRQFRDQLKFQSSMTASVSPAERMKVYRYAYYARISESLEDDFPVSLKLTLHYRDLLKEFIQSNPSKYASLAELSRDFPEYLEGRFGKGALADLAHLEWVRTQATAASATRPEFHAEKVSGETRLVIAPGVFLFTSMWAVDRANSGIATILREPLYLLICSTGNDYEETRISEDLHKLLSFLKSGRTVTEIAAWTERLGLTANWLEDAFKTCVKKGILSETSHS